jgi:hypothetical protein
MNKPTVVALLLLTVAAGGRLSAEPRAELELSLVDESGSPLPGVVQILDNGKSIELPELVNRGQGIDAQGPIHQWWALPRSAKLAVPRGLLTVRAFAGLETEMATSQIDLSSREHAKLEVHLHRFYDARRGGRLAGNTHLHLMKLSKAQADRYLQEVPLADGLDIVFLSYLERAVADLEYTSNKYSPHDLDRLSHGHLHFGHGQEHRHNFGSHGEGYGHILLLDIPYIIQPVSIGPGIMRSGSDTPPLQAGIDEARRTGGKVIWAHNLFGFEDIPNWVTGRVDANNIYDGSHRGSYKDTYYRYLDIGLSVPFSTGTDWFIYDFSRVYVQSARAVTPTGWLELLAAGKSWITNGPLLEFTVDDRPLGSTINLTGPGAVKVRANALGRLDFKHLELIHNGRVIRSAPSDKVGEHFAAQMEFDLPVEQPAWLAARTPPPPAPDDPTPDEPVAENEFGGKLFSHTSPVYVHVDGRGVFDSAVAEGLIVEMRSSVEKIKEQAVFASDADRQRVLGVYDQAISVLERRIAEHAETHIQETLQRSE